MMMMSPNKAQIVAEAGATMVMAGTAARIDWNHKHNDK